jgi:hypothetical protein
VSALFSEIAADTSPRGVVVGLWARRGFMALFAAFAALALLDVFGQRSTERAAASDVATLRLSSPSSVRGGLFFQSRVDVRALRTIEHPRLVLDDGWVEGMQVNSISPSAVGEAARDGRIVLSYNRLDAGERLVVWLQFQVNPTALGRRSYDVELDDETTPIVRINRGITVLP